MLLRPELLSYLLIYRLSNIEQRWSHGPPVIKSYQPKAFSSAHNLCKNDKISAHFLSIRTRTSGLTTVIKSSWFQKSKWHFLLSNAVLCGKPKLIGRQKTSFFSDFCEEIFHNFKKIFLPKLGLLWLWITSESRIAAHWTSFLQNSKTPFFLF